MGFAATRIDHSSRSCEEQGISARHGTRAVPLTLVTGQPVKPACGSSTLFLCVVLIGLQIADLLLTFTGVSHFGADAEGNPILRSLMEMIGTLPALIVVKVLAVSLILFVYGASQRIPWVPGALKVVVAVYLFAAIIPWSGILLLHFSS